MAFPAHLCRCGRISSPTQIAPRLPAMCAPSMKSPTKTFPPSPHARMLAFPAATASKKCTQAHDPHDPQNQGWSVAPAGNEKYSLPMCPGVESDRPGDCSKPEMALEQNPVFQEETKTIYTCPMHPEIRQDQPGYCPICGMALEPVAVTGEATEENSEAKDMTRRFWIATILAAPVFLLAMAYFMPGLQLARWIPLRLNQWIQFLFTTPVVLWAGWPFFVRGWNSLR